MALLQWTAGNADVFLDLDVVERDGYEVTAEVTDHAVERGANVADHVRPGNDTFTIEGMVTNQPIVQPRYQMDGVTGRVQTADLKTAGKASTFQWSAPFNRVRVIDTLLAGLVRDGVLVKYTTSLRTVDDVVITRHKAERSAATGDAINVTLELRRVRLVSTQRVAVPDPAQRRGQAQRDRGTAPGTTPTPARERSALAAAEDAPRVRERLGRYAGALGVP